MKVYKYAAGIAVGTGILILSYYWKILGDRGLTADANGTAGYTTNLEILTIVTGFLLVVLGLVVLMRSRRD